MYLLFTGTIAYNNWLNGILPSLIISIENLRVYRIGRHIEGDGKPPERCKGIAQYPIPLWIILNLLKQYCRTNLLTPLSRYRSRLQVPVHLLLYPLQIATLLQGLNKFPQIFVWHNSPLWFDRF